MEEEEARLEAARQHELKSLELAWKGTVALAVSSLLISGSCLHWKLSWIPHPLPLITTQPADCCCVVLAHTHTHTQNTHTHTHKTAAVQESEKDPVWIWQEERAEEAARGAGPYAYAFNSTLH